MEIPSGFDAFESQLIERVTHLTISVEEAAQRMKDAIAEFGSSPEELSNQFKRLG